MYGDHQRMLETGGRVGVSRLRLVVADKGGAVVLAVLEVGAPGCSVVDRFEATVAPVDALEVAADRAALVDILEVAEGVTVTDAADVLEVMDEFAVVDVLEVVDGFVVVDVLEVAYGFAVVEVLEVAD